MTNFIASLSGSSQIVPENSSSQPFQRSSDDTFARTYDEVLAKRDAERTSEFSAPPLESEDSYESTLDSSREPYRNDSQNMNDDNDHPDSIRESGTSEEQMRDDQYADSGESKESVDNGLFSAEFSDEKSIQAGRNASEARKGAASREKKPGAADSDGSLSSLSVSKSLERTGNPAARGGVDRNASEKDGIKSVQLKGSNPLQGIAAASLNYGGSAQPVNGDSGLKSAKADQVQTVLGGREKPSQKSDADLLASVKAAASSGQAGKVAAFQVDSGRAGKNGLSGNVPAGQAKGSGKLKGKGSSVRTFNQQMSELQNSNISKNIDRYTGVAEQSSGSQGVQLETSELPQTQIAELNVDMNDLFAGKEGDPFKTAQAERAVADRLQTHLKEQLNTSVVRQAQVLLDKEGKGEIHLILRPEKLGRVKIRLNLEDNHIAGRIFVENSSVKEVFEQNLHHLTRAFREAGMDFQGMDVSVGDGRTDQQQGEQNHQRNDARALEAMSDAVPLLGAADQYGESRINLVV